MTTRATTQVIKPRVISTSSGTKGTRPVEVAGYASFIILIATMMFVDNVWTRLPIICAMISLVLIFGFAQIIDRKTRIHWRFASLTMVGFVFWHIITKGLLGIGVLVIAVGMVLNRPIPLC